MTDHQDAWQPTALNRQEPTRRDLLVGSGAAGAAALVTALPMPALAQADQGPRVGRYASTGPLAHSTNTYWIETADGVFVVDGQWTLPFAHEAMTQMRGEVGDKPILGLLITHDHTDHYGGMDAVLEAARQQGTETLPIYASRQTRLSLLNDAQGFQSNRSEQSGADFGLVTVPTNVVEDGDAIDLGGIVLRVMERPLNEAPSTILIYAEGASGSEGDDGTGALICGDIVYDRRLPIAREGFAGIENWLVQLSGLRANHGDAVLHMGHGAPRRGSDVISEQMAMLRALRDPVINAVERDGVLREAERDRIVANLVDRYADWVTIVGLTHEQVFTLSLDWIADGVDAAPPRSG